MPSSGQEKRHFAYTWVPQKASRVACAKNTLKQCKGSDGDTIDRVATQFIIQMGILLRVMRDASYKCQGKRYARGLSQTNWKYEHLVNRGQH